LQQPVEVSHKGGFTGSVLTNDGNLLASFNAKRNAAQGFESGGIGKVEIVDFYFH
jgi:hypothetical protein